MNYSTFIVTKAVLRQKAIRLKNGCPKAVEDSFLVIIHRNNRGRRGRTEVQISFITISGFNETWWITFVTYKNIEEKMAKQSHILGSHDKVLLIKQLKC